NGGTWLRFNTTGGFTPADFSVSVDATNLTPGNYTGQILVSAVGATPVTIPVQVTVTGPAAIALSANTLSFTADVGTNPSTQTVRVTNVAAGALGVTATAATTKGGSWLTLAPATGVTPLTLTASVNSASLAAGIYQGTI